MGVGRSWGKEGRTKSKGQSRVGVEPVQVCFGRAPDNQRRRAKHEHQHYIPSRRARRAFSP
jgi:hypothetical protein